jgi:GTP-binding protein LepA
MSFPIERIRNFCIIAHIDHGKSTLADRILEYTGAITKREAKNQLLDDMDLERERGITIKAKAVSIRYSSAGEEYLLNLIDTPGHVDFSYEVSRSLAACEGAILLVDAAQGVEAQTVANTYLAMEDDLHIIGVVNKVDLVQSRPDEIREEMEQTLGIEAEEILGVSAKSGLGIAPLIEKVIKDIPPPQGDPSKPLRALIFDSVYDDYKGVIVYFRVIDGVIKSRDRVLGMGGDKNYEVNEVGYFAPKETPVKELGPGEVGYFWGSIKTLSEVTVGDTITHHKSSGIPAEEPLPGYKQPLPMVYCGIYPTFNADLPNLRKGLEKLRLNDASFTFETESSEALGMGFRCGFLGLLHMEIVQERLERESNLQIVQTSPTVTYEIELNRGDIFKIRTPAELPDPSQIAELREPIARATILCPTDEIGNVMKLNEEKRGIYKNQEYIGPGRVMLTYEVPLSELIFDYYDKLKGMTHGYGTLDYEVKGYEPADMVRVDILVNAAKVDALSCIVHRSIAEQRGRELLVRLKKEIPRHMFEVPLQAAIGGKIIARENIRALRKNVTAKCYGGDITRKRKLLEKQKEGKKRMKHVGNVAIPQDAFLTVLGSKDDKKRRNKGKSGNK